MRIKDICVTPIAIPDPPLMNAVGIHANYALRIITELTTEDGIVGISEIPGGDRNLTALNKLARRLPGMDVRDRRHLDRLIAEELGDEEEARGSMPWDQRVNVHSRSAIEVACYDIEGRATGVPVYMLLGGAARRRVPFAGYLFYKHEGVGGENTFKADANGAGWLNESARAVLNPDDLVRQAESMVKNFGFRALKLKGGVLPAAVEVETMKALANHFGPDIKLRFDPNAAWSMDVARKYTPDLVDILEYLEDPVAGQTHMAQLANEFSVPLATNMCTTSFDEIPRAIRLGSESVILADHHFWGGLGPTLELATIARVFNRSLSMHSNTHLGISLMAMAHLGSAIPEITHDIDTHYPWAAEDLISGGKIEFQDGCIVMTDEPGLGVDIDQTKLQHFADLFRAHGESERDDQAERTRRQSEKKHLQKNLA